MKNNKEQKMTIQKADLEDIEEILTIQKKAFISQAEIYDDFMIHPLVETIEEALEDFKLKQVLKAVIDDHIVGAVRVMLKDSTCHIGKLFVDPEFQGRGIGTNLLYKAEEMFGNYNRLELFTGYMSQDNIRLYESLGYKKFKTTKHNGKADYFVYMEKYK
jgi:ribosomal protein S18 acetylase RimI-like enzyme